VRTGELHGDLAALKPATASAIDTRSLTIMGLDQILQRYYVPSRRLATPSTALVTSSHSLR
jgi:hypothetical protein